MVSICCFKVCHYIIKHFELFSSFPKIQRLAEGLAPCYLRVGGSSADFLQFNPRVQREKNMKRSGDEYLKFRPYKKRNIPFEDTLEIQKLKNFTMSGN